MGPTEDLPIADDSDEEDNDEEYTIEDHPVSENVLARVESFRTQLVTMEESKAKHLAATKIQSMVRGYFIYTIAINIQITQARLEIMRSRIGRQEFLVRNQIRALKMGTGWRKHIISKIQAVWRGYSARKTMKYASYLLPYTVLPRITQV